MADISNTTQSVISHALAVSWPVLALVIVLYILVVAMSRTLPRLIARAVGNLFVHGALVAPRRSELRRRANHARIGAAARLSLMEIHRIRPSQSPGRFFQYIRAVNPYVFEELVLLELRRRKLDVVQNRSYSNDGGVDGEVWIGGVRYLIQAKRYVDFILPDHVYNFEMLCRQNEAFGVFIHTGKTSSSAAAKIRQSTRVSVISGQALVEFFSSESLRLTAGGRATGLV